MQILQHQHPYGIQFTIMIIACTRTRTHTITHDTQMYGIKCSHVAPYLYVSDDAGVELSIELIGDAF